MLSLIELTSRRRLGLMLVALALVILGATALMRTVTADPGLTFGDVEVGVQAAARQGEGEPIGKWVKTSGLEVAALALLADQTQTTVTLRVRGSGQETVLTGGGVVLVDAVGGEHRVISGSTHAQDASLKTLVFEPIPASAGEMRIVVDELYVESATLPSLRVVKGPWSLRFDFSGRVLPVKTYVVAAADQRRPFGKGTVVVESVVQAPSGTVIRGRIEGYGFEEVPLFQLRAVLLKERTEVLPISLRGGFGDARERFEFRFPPTTGSLSLQIVSWIRPDIDVTEQWVAETVASAKDARGQWELSLQ